MDYKPLDGGHERYPLLKATSTRYIFFVYHQSLPHRIISIISIYVRSCYPRFAPQRGTRLSAHGPALPPSRSLLPWC